ncbi:MAG: hypothetical protein WB816_06880 [Methylocystis sp.]
MTRVALLAAFTISLIGLDPAAAQQRTRDQGDWPCRQVKVADLSLAAIWSGPPIDEAAKIWRDDAVIADLVARISARRTPIETATQLVDQFAKGAGASRKQRLTLLFAGVYDKLDGERREVVAGLDRYGRAQKDIAERLRDETQKLRDAQDAHVDAEKLKQMSDALQWDMRLFDERRKAVSFVCETPALIEQRLGALTQAIRDRME